MLRLETAVVNAAAEYRNIRCYVRSGVQVDNDALEAEFKGLEAAVRTADLAAARQRNAAILARLNKVPQARSVCADMKMDLKLFEAVLSPNGLSPTSPTARQRARELDHRSGRWGLSPTFAVADDLGVFAENFRV